MEICIMIFTKSISENCVGIVRSVTDKKDAVAHIVDLALNHPALKDVDRDTLRERILEREELQSTALGDRIAIPHCRLPGLQDFATGLMVIPEGVDFGAPNGEKTYVFVFVVAPEERSDDHIRLLSQVSRTLTTAGFVDGLLNSSEKELYNRLKNAIPVQETEISGPRNQVTIIVAGDERFMSLLEIAAGIPQSSVWTQTIQSTRHYFERVPLFAAFSGDVRPKEYRMISAVVPRSLSNALVRAIDEFCDPLSKCGDVLVTVRELAHANGALEL
jgi:PTS system nitrogen regulatory IIA component